MALIYKNKLFAIKGDQAAIPIPAYALTFLVYLLNVEQDLS